MKPLSRGFKVRPYLLFMAVDVKIPPMGESITGGLLAAWLVKNGDAVRKGQPLFSYETDKVTSEGTAEVDGRITIAVEAGTEVLVGQVVASIEAGAAGNAPSAPAAPAAPAATKPATPVSAAASAAPAATPVAAKSGAAAEVSPAVRRLSAETGLDPAALEGTGKAGRVTKGDMLAALAGQVPIKAVAPATAAPAAPTATTAPAVEIPSRTGRTSRKRMSPLRRKIAERLVQAKSETAMLTTFNEVNMAPVMELRKRHGEEFLKKYGVKLGFMSFFVKAAVHALKKYPVVNASVDGTDIVYHGFFDIGVAVGSPRGLVVPVVRNADQLNFAQIEKTIADYGKRAADGKLGIEELTGGTFSISNGGVFGSMLSTPIINPPQSAILGVHATKDRAVVENGQVVVRPINYLALSYDHRIIDGREAVLFLVSIKEALEDPARLLLDL